MIGVAKAKRTVHIWEPAEGWSWVEHALCRDHPNAEWWTSEHSGERRKAAEICDECPVGPQCLDAIMSFPSHARWHVWAGFNWGGDKRRV